MLTAEQATYNSTDKGNPFFISSVKGDCHGKDYSLPQVILRNQPVHIRRFQKSMLYEEMNFFHHSRVHPGYTNSPQNFVYVRTKNSTNSYANSIHVINEITNKKGRCILVSLFLCVRLQKQTELERAKG